MAVAASRAIMRKIKVNGTLILEFPDGTEIRITPPSAVQAKGLQGRPPGPATIALKEAMQRDAKAGKRRDRAYYLDLLHKAGHAGSDASAYLIVRREAKRAFGGSLGRQPGLKRKTKVSGKSRGRRPSPETALLRAKIAADKEAGTVKDARYYVGWLMDQPAVILGIKKARPIVYRELRAAES